ncbi:MAG: hypothetical protein AAB666_02435 [Patescibacteria group bacterium]
MFLKYKLWKIKKIANPSKQFRAALWQKLEREIIVEPRVYFWQMPVMRYAAVALSLVLALGIGTGAYAYSSPEVNEAHPLYGLKKEIEKIEERVVARTPESLATFQAKQMERRLAEIERLQSRKLNFEKTLDELNKTEEAGLKALDFVTSLKVQGIIKQRINLQGEERQKQLEKAKMVLPQEAEKRIEAMMQKREKRLEIQEQKFEKKLEQIEKQREEIQQQPINILPNKGRAEEKPKNSN